MSYIRLVSILNNYYSSRNCAFSTQRRPRTRSTPNVFVFICVHIKIIAGITSWWLTKVMIHTDMYNNCSVITLYYSSRRVFCDGYNYTHVILIYIYIYIIHPCTPHKHMITFFLNFLHGPFKCLRVADLSVGIHTFTL